MGQSNGAGKEDPIEIVIPGRKHDLGGLEVRRVLPFAQRRMVGPFIFLDHLGPVTLPAGRGIDVRPHPHIGLATVTYLYEGHLMHRDSLGVVQRITPGDVNWMTAGRGIVHSERSDERSRDEAEEIAGLQFWVALPASHEETEPGFQHHAAATLPELEGEGARIRVVAGQVFDLTSPVQTLSPLFLADVQLEKGARISLDPRHEERAAYVVEGSIVVGGKVFESGNLVVFVPGQDVQISSSDGARFALLGGATIDGPRHIWWNFVSSSKDRIEQAKSDWREGRFARVPGETEFIPLPE